MILEEREQASISSVKSADNTTVCKDSAFKSVFD